ncbi:MAG: DNA primase [Alphaproteobacteria bacterium]|nr:DNA primase [Alphaproteobacteria bacterium]
MNDDLLKFLDELRSRISVAEVIGEKVKLQKRGREYTGLCPFHQEKTPSFTINESKGFYHCFGCGAHGDVVKFVMDSEGLPFIEAVKKLASRVGMELPALSKESQEAAQRRKSLYEIMDMAADFFEKNLYMPVGAHGLSYYRQKRGLSDETIKKFRLGYAPGNNALKAYLTSKGIFEQDMADLGLISIPEDANRKPNDFFYDRVMIPIMDKQKNIIAFGGRILGDGQPKYLNSPETPIFNKRRILYNMNNARESAYANKRLIICEGYMDVIALDSFGFTYATAPLGTALTEEQIIEAWKVCNTPTLCFDGDTAGIRAAIRSVDRILPNLRAGYSVNYIFLKGAKDPDELLHKFGAETFEKYMVRAKPLVDILWHKCKMNKDSSTPEQKALIEKEIFEEVAKIKDNQIRNYYTQEMKKRIYYTFGRGAEFKNNQPTNNNTGNSNNHKDHNYNKLIHKNYSKTSLLRQGGNLIKKPPLTDLFIRKIAAAMILYPQLAEAYCERLADFEISKSSFSKILNEIMEIMQEEKSTDSATLVEKLRLNFANEIDGLWELNMYKMQKIDLPDLKTEINDCLKEIQLKQIDTEINECTSLLKKQPENAEKIYERYKQLIIERNKFLTDDNFI